MTQKDLTAIYRFLGAVEGVLFALPEGAQTLLLDYMEAVDAILAKEEGITVKMSFPWESKDND